MKLNRLTEPIRLSRWAHIIQRDGVYALFHSLNLSLLFLEKRFEEFLNELRFGTTAENLRKFGEEVGEIIEELLAQQLVVPANHDDDAVLKEKQNIYVGKPNLETVFMLLTDVCNLECAYCFIKGNTPKDKPVRIMSQEIAQEAIDMYFSNLRPTKFRKTVVFYGGEPTLAFSLLKWIVEYIQNQYPEEYAKFDVGLLVITNGTKITDEVAAYFAEHREIALNISLDGNKDTNDQKRVYADGSGSFTEIIDGIERLHKVGRRDINISVTIDSHNIDKLDEMFMLHERFHFQSINFNPLLDTINREIDPNYTEHATKKLLEYFERAREIGLYEDRIMRKVRAISRGVLHPFDCRATGEQLAISPDGFMGICHEGVGYKNFFFGKVSKSLVFEKNPIVQEWSLRSPLMMQQCFNCPSLGLCGGGCAYCAYLRHGTIWAIDDKFCKHSLAVLNWIIWDVYKRM